jgi:hypothetical protein
MTRRALLTVTVLLAMAGFAFAQSNKDKKEDANQRTIEGVVTDASRGLVARAIVQLKDMRTLQIRSFVSQADGAYHFAGLRMDTDYEIKASLDDLSSDTKRVSSFESRKTVTVNLQLGKK